jgi:hypothetical protein
VKRRRRAYGTHIKSVAEFSEPGGVRCISYAALAAEFGLGTVHTH